MAAVIAAGIEFMIAHDGKRLATLGHRPVDVDHPAAAIDVSVRTVDPLLAEALQQLDQPVAGPCMYPMMS